MEIAKSLHVPQGHAFGHLAYRRHYIPVVAEDEKLRGRILLLSSLSAIPVRRDRHGRHTAPPEFLMLPWQHSSNDCRCASFMHVTKDRILLEAACTRALDSVSRILVIDISRLRCERINHEHCQILTHALA